VLAEAGLLQHERVTLHWEAASAFQERYPSLTVSQELFEIDARRITCAGGTASIDLMLDLIGRRHGAELAAQVSEQFVLGRIRQRSDHQRMQIAARYGIHNRKLIQVIGVMEQHMEEPLSPDALAEEIGVTRRQLERLFCSAMKDTPTHFYLGLRLARAANYCNKPTCPSPPCAWHAASITIAFLPHLPHPLRFQPAPGPQLAMRDGALAGNRRGKLTQARTAW